MVINECDLHAVTFVAVWRVLFTLPAKHSACRVHVGSLSESQLSIDKCLLSPMVLSFGKFQSLHQKLYFICIEISLMLTPAETYSF